MKHLVLLAAFFCACATPKDYTQWVDPTIGSGGHGHVFVGANVPHGMVQLGPVNITTGWDWCSGYHQSDSSLIGYAHTHLSGTGIGDKGDILFMPFTGALAGADKSQYLSTYLHQDERAEAGFYELTDLRYGVKAELTASERVGFHRYTYPQGAERQMLVNLKQGIGWDKAMECSIRKVDDTTIEGTRLSKGWAVDDRVYFVARFSAPIQSFEYIDTAKTAVIDFGVGENLSVEVALSGTSVAGAHKNLAQEGGKSFDVARGEAKAAWNKLLGSIDAQTADTNRLKTFYTALYHTAFFPCVFHDVDGTYRGADGKIYRSKNEVYTVFSLWDTYRAAHPLYTLTSPSRARDMVLSMLDIYDQQGYLPVWHLWGNETDCMTGVPSVQVVGDAVIKGLLTPEESERAFRAMKAYADLDYRGLKEIRERGFYPADSDVESVARAMEYCISDAAVAKVAAKLGYTEDAAHFTARSQNYKRYFDPSDRFVKGLLADGTRRTPFDPMHSTHREDDFCEGNAWQYTFMVPHDFEGLFSLFPSKAEARAKLDSTFSVPYVASENASSDISGMIGQVAHGNEPSHATAFAYAALGDYDRTADLVRHIMDSLYFPTPEGISGNEDCGQMSAWYVLNALGFYQVDAGGGEWIFGSPVFDQATIQLPDNKIFTIKTKGTGHRIASVGLNGAPYDKRSIGHQEIMAGGELIFTMKQ